MISFCDRRDRKREAGPPMEGQLLNFSFLDFQLLLSDKQQTSSVTLS